MHSAPYKKFIEASKTADDTESNWLITLSDVLSLLLVFFIMFYFMNKNSPQSPGQKADVHEIARQETDRMKALPDNTPLFYPAGDAAERIKNEMNAAIKEMNLVGDVSVHTLKKEIIITMREKVTFRSGEADMLGDSEPILDKIASIIKDQPSFMVEIEGHTDNVPINSSRYPSNWELSVARSAGVLKYFMGKHGIEPTRFSIKGNADQRPLALNDTAEQRAQNRRVEIRLKEQGSSG